MGIVGFLVAFSLHCGSAAATFPGADGHIAFAVDAPPGSINLFTALPDGSNPEQLTSDGLAEGQSTWSPDGQRIVFARAAGSRQVLISTNADGSDPMRIGRVRNARSASFSPNGQRLIYSNGRAIRTIRLDGTGSRRLLTKLPNSSFAEPEYSPGGKRILATGQPSKTSKEGIWTMRRNGSRAHQLVSFANAAVPDYSPDGKSIVFERVASDHCCNGIFTVRADGSDVRRVPYPSANAAAPVFSPSGDRIALMLITGDYQSGECSDIYTMSPTGGGLQRVTFGCDPSGQGTSSAAPSWQPLSP